MPSRQSMVVVVAVVALVCGVMLSGASRFFTKRKMNAGSAVLSSTAESKSDKNRDVLTFKSAVMNRWKSKPEVMEHYGKKPDEFFQRFYKYVQVERTSTNAGINMITNFAEFMIEQKKKGTLNGFGAGVLTEAINSGAVRLMSGKYRDAQGRRIILTKAANADKVSEDLQAKIFLYIFLKLSSFDDTVEPGFTIAHDLEDASLMSLKGLSSTVQSVFPDNSFPVNLKKILLMNYEKCGFALKVFIKGFSAFAPDFTELKTLPSLTNPTFEGGLYYHIPKASLPSGAPFDGNVNEEDVTASMLVPGLGIFFEPEMDPKENTASA